MLRSVITTCESNARLGDAITSFSEGFDRIVINLEARSNIKCYVFDDLYFVTSFFSDYLFFQ